MVGARLRTLIAVARACGFHLLSIDLRQNADVHERMIHELYVRAGVNIDYLGSDEAERVRVLSKELSHDRPLRSPFLDYSEETMRELGVLDAAAEVVRLYGEKALGACIISKTATLSDVLEPLVLLKQAGLVQGGDKGRSAVRISPLLETIGDLEHGPELLRQWLALPCRRPCSASPSGARSCWATRTPTRMAVTSRRATMSARLRPCWPRRRGSRASTCGSSTAAADRWGAAVVLLRRR